MSPVLLFDRVRLLDGREGTVIECDGYHALIELQGGGKEKVLAGTLNVIDWFRPVGMAA